jgi:hypothetical protein
VTTVYVPGTSEKDPTKIVMSLQANAAQNTTNATNIATNTANIATNASNISALQTKTDGYEAAWTTWSPTVTPSSGAFTTVSATGAYLAIGKLVHFTVTITITSVGTASGTMSIALPTGTAKRPAAVVAVETANVGLMGYGRIATGGSTIAAISRYDNSTYCQTNNVLTLTGIYEKA